MTAPKVKATAKFAAFDYQAVFAEPILDLLRIMSCNRVYEALKPWNISPENVKYRAGQLSTTEPIVSFELAKGNYTVSLGMANFAFKGVNVAWDQAPVIIEILKATTHVLERDFAIKVAQHNLTIAMQLGLQGKAIRDLTLHLSKPLGLPETTVDFYGFLLYGKDGSVIVDKSAADPTDLFVKISKKYIGTHAIEEMARELFEDEQGLANTLGIEIE